VADPLPIPAADPRASFLAHRAEIEEAIVGVLNAGRYILGEEVGNFQREFARFLGAESAVGVASGTDALVLALRACGVGPGDAVLTVSHTAVATIAAIELAGAAPVLVDIDAATFTMDPNHLEEAARDLSKNGNRAGANLKAIVPVHLYGHPADLSAVAEVARRFGLRLIEDCAQAHGAMVGGRAVGTWGDAGVFSFYPTKNLGAIGDAGAVSTMNPDLARRVARLREYGWEESRASLEPGFNSRLDEIQAAILRVKLHHLEAENLRRRHLASIYAERLQGSRVIAPIIREGAQHVFHQFVVRCHDRDRLREDLRDRGIGTLVHYPLPVHLQPAYRDRLRHGPGGLERTERACREIVSLPIHPQLSDDQVREVAVAISDWDRRPG
jgi:dTDP-4-amino-4,6-dideoxygalactose transaminase